MIQITPQMRVLVAVQPADFRCGIDGLARQCQAVLESDPFSGIMFVFRNRRRTAVKLLVYDRQGFWLCQKRLSTGRFRHWPDGRAAGARLEVHELHVLVRGGDYSSTRAAPTWRPVVALQRHRHTAAQDPAAWMPRNWRSALAALDPARPEVR